MLLILNSLRAVVFLRHPRIGLRVCAKLCCTFEIDSSPYPNQQAVNRVLNCRFCKVPLAVPLAGGPRYLNHRRRPSLQGLDHFAAKRIGRVNRKNFGA